MTKGKYILFEGPEGAGKTTQINFLIDYLNQINIPTIKTREPGGTPFAEEMRIIVKHSKEDFGALEEMFLFSAGRANLFRKLIIPKLNEGQWVIADRGFYSTEVYQGYAGGKDLEQIRYFNEIAMQGIKPDLTIILDVPTYIGLKQEQEGGRMTDKGREFHEKVREGYLKVAKEHPKDCILISYLQGQIEKIQEQIQKSVNSRFIKN